MQLESSRLLLRPFLENDIDELAALANDYRIAKTTIELPYPYTKEDARWWIGHHPGWIEEGSRFPFAVTKKGEGELMGNITVRMQPEHQRGELGYWLGTDYWGSGYMSEAAELVRDFSFRSLEAHRLIAPVMSKNQASAKVVKRIGMRYEGTLRQDVWKWSRYEDVDMYGMLAAEWGRA
ncbi:GNAT family N-acetyltransferase [Marinococcus halophilus]|uniref:GNAT family acetyltransferase n=1 Tax=Marinococcus halophilus TaxID=1371 RepID=A0A510Y589_MARHA|nr:GNAT family protein [Marinococcus halophilus]OZT80437.1 GNAT family N-acetyltransferase [Marinococcus halophilus]GEK58508.1 GNAT family acetyltransferase [Marinococcus halophilus]